jgi:NAD(P)-dependent dehydrogenase (short-subunit alcohol dehydrogenase family)
MSPKNIWFITGVSSGLGLALALHVLQAGDTVYGTVRNRERAAEAVSQIEEAGGTCVVLDITDLDSIPGVVERIISKEGKIDILVNNAGLGLLATVEDTRSVVNTILSRCGINTFPALNFQCSKCRPTSLDRSA